MRHNRERHATLTEVEEGQEQDVLCFDDISGYAMRRNYKFLRHSGVCEKVYVKEAVAKCGIIPVDTTWVDTD